MSVSPRRSVSGPPQPTHALHGGAGDEAYADSGEDDALGSVRTTLSKRGTTSRTARSCWRVPAV